MRSRVMPAAIALLVGVGAASGHSQSPAPSTAPSTAQGGAPSVVVPQGNGVPVITDGIFTPGEWDDAERVAVADGVTLHIKEYRGVVFIGVRGQAANGIGPSELSLAVPNGPILKLHASFALWEIVLPRGGPEPKPRIGFTADWYANELRRDETEFARLQKEGRSPIEVMQATTYPSDGIEFAIRRSKLPGQVWLMRLWASAFVGGKPGMVTFPAAAAERATDAWLEMRFK